MKKFTQSLNLVCFAVIFSLLFTSCEKVEYDHRHQFVGNYDVEEYSYRGNKVSVFQSRISLIADSDEDILISNFFGSGRDVIAVVMGSKFFIPDQTLRYSEVKSGQGSIGAGNVLYLDYTVDVSFPNSATYTDFLEATYVKRP
jgi:hypothetical protein